MHLIVANVCVFFKIRKCPTATKGTVRNNNNNEKVFIPTVNKNLL